MISNSTVRPWKYVTKQRGIKPNLLLGHTISAFTSPCTSCGLEHLLHKIKVLENKQKVSTSKAVFSLGGYIQKTPSRGAVIDQHLQKEGQQSTSCSLNLLTLLPCFKYCRNYLRHIAKCRQMHNQL